MDESEHMKDQRNGGEVLQPSTSNDEPQNLHCNSEHSPKVVNSDEIDNEEEDCDSVDEDLDVEALAEKQKGLSEDEIQQLKEEAANMKNEGNDYFKKLEFKEAIKAYTRALNTCPLKCDADRSILYANRAAARINLDKEEDAILDCNSALELNPNYMKALIRRAQLYRKTKELDRCLADYQKILELDQNNQEARQACAVLPGEIAERNEKLKTEMMGKLKDLGNLCLRPFGLSTDNFNMVQDPETGGYSIKFQNK